MAARRGNIIEPALNADNPSAHPRSFTKFTTLQSRFYKPHKLTRFFEGNHKFQMFFALHHGKRGSETSLSLV